MLTLPLPPQFDLSIAVCSYGFFKLAPNRWDAQHRALKTIVHGADQRPLPITISQRGDDGRSRLRIAAPAGISRDDAAALRRQAARMLRLDEDFTGFHQLHQPARAARFGCLFRSATLFEDIVKTITACNVTWPNTLRMNALLCEHYGDGGFPTPAQLAAATPARLKRLCKVGYRAERIIRLARDVDRGRLDLDWFEQPGRTTAELYEGLLAIFGIGPYAAANLCQLLGRYDRLAIDSETYRHFRQHHNKPTPKSPAELRILHDHIESHYARYAPYQFLAYWFDLWGGYDVEALGA